MARNLKNVFLPKAFGPGGGRILQCSFSVAAAVLTALEEQGCTVLRTGVGQYDITLPRVYKFAEVHVNPMAASTAQLFIVTNIDLPNRLITIKQVTAGGGTAVDTITARVDVMIFARTVS
jgi:hypothetical protein